MKGFSIFCACLWGFRSIAQIAYLMGAVETGITPATGLFACLLATLLFIDQAVRC